MKTAEKSAFAEQLRACRDSVGLSQTDLAVALNVNRSTVSRAENADLAYLPPGNLFERIVEELTRSGCSEELVSDLRDSWQAARPFRVTRLESAEVDPVLQRAADELSAWPPTSAERMALADDIKTTVHNWHKYRIAIHHLASGMHDFARDGFESLIVSLENGGQTTQPRLLMRAYVGLAHACRYLGEAEQALKHELPQALRLAKQLGPLENQWQGRILLATGNFQRRLGYLDDAIYAYEQSGTVFSQLPEVRERTLGLAEVERKIGATMLFRGDASGAEIHFRRSIHLCIDLGESEEQRKGQQHLAWAYALLGRYDDALRIHQRVLSELRTDNGISLVTKAKAQRYYADLLGMCRKLEDALEAYGQAIQDYREYAGTLTLEEGALLRGPIFLGLGQTYLLMDRLHEAESNLRQSEIINKHDPFFLAQTQSWLGNLAAARADYSQAERYYAEALKTFTEHKNHYYTTEIHLQRADLELARGDLDKARRIVEEVIASTAGEDNFLVHRVRAHCQLAAQKLRKWPAENPLFDYYEALRIAGEDLDNPYLFDGVLKHIDRQLRSLANAKQLEQPLELNAQLQPWRGRVRTSTKTMNDNFDKWLQDTGYLLSSL